MSYFVGNIDVSGLVHSGDTNFTDTFSGFPACTSTTNTWEHLSTALGYEISGTDIANGVQAKYNQYTSSVTGITPEPWCRKVKIIAIAGGGGGGSGGANKGNNRAGAGGSGGGGTLAIMTSNNFDQSNYRYAITIDAGGAGGAYQGTEGSDGHSGAQGSKVTITVSSGNNTGTLAVFGGGGGGYGPGTDRGNNNSTGGVNNTAITTSLGNLDNLFNVDHTTGNSGSGAGNGYVSAAGYVVNYAAANTNGPPVLNLDKDWTHIANNNTQYDNGNQVPGYGQGGVGGFNSNNTNGYYGQNGGPALVRIYYMQ